MTPRRSGRTRVALWAAMLAVACVVPAACAPEGDGPDKPPASPRPSTREPTATEESPMVFTLTSPAFKEGERIPKEHSGEGKDASPPLEWTNPPPGTRTFALVCDDPDAPRGTWDHWLIWNLPADCRKLPEGVPTTETVADLGGARQGNNSWPKIGYGGPMPPPGHGVHHYHFRLVALDTELDLAPGADKEALMDAMEGHILGTAKLTGLYSR